MEIIKEIVLAICGGAVVLYGIWLLVPNGKMQRPMQYILSLALLVTIVTPFALKLAFFSIDIQAADSTAVSESFENLSKANAVALIEDILKKNEVEALNIEVFMDISEDYSISIKKAVIVAAEGDEATAREALAEIGFEIEIKEPE